MIKLTWILFSLCAVLHAESLTLSGKCEGKAACLEMDLNHGSAWKKSTQTTSSPQDATGNTKYSLSVTGKLERAGAKKHTVEFTAYTDGIECTDFGQGQVAVLGVVKGNPILLTNRGALEVTDNSLEVGCADCARFVDKKSKKSTPVLTRTSNMTLPEITATNVDEKGAVFFRQGAKCVEATGGEFKEVASDRCGPGFSTKYPAISEGAVKKDFPWLKPSTQETVHDVGGGKLFVLKLSACS